MMINCTKSRLAAVTTLLLALAFPVRGGDTPPDLTIALGAKNVGSGLVVPSAGDGVNVPEVVQGVPARRIAGNGSTYMYVRIDHPSYAKGPVDVFVTVEFLDEAIGRLGLEFDRAGGTGGHADRYVEAGDAILLTGSGTWRRGVFHLPALRLGRGQNWGTDFRITGRRVAVRRISVSPRPPAGYDPDRPHNEEGLRAVAVRRAPGMELTFGNDAGPTEAALYKALSVTSVESYVDWAGVEPDEGKWDWSRWDKQVAVLRKNGLKWVPFLIAGPAYATPGWFRDGSESHVYRCLEHGQDSKVQSLFNPRLRPRIQRFLQAFADRYRDSGVIESVLLGVSGIYGESLYPAGPEGGWTAERTGPYHNHAGWWAGDELAGSAFRESLRARYGSVAALNRAWGTSHRTFDDVKTFLPDKAPGDRARADLVEWYQQAMTDWSVFWVQAARQVFPKTEIYLCTGGDGNPILGADFTAQAAAVAPFGAGVRITNEGSSYIHNFTLTREVATATRHVGTFCGFEPASAVDAAGVVGRIYNATASGARQLHDYNTNMPGDDPAAMRNFRANIPLLIPRRPRIDVALYLSRETWALDPGAIDRTYALARVVRDAADLDFVTRRSAIDGRLSAYRTLVLADSPVLEPEVAGSLEAWVREGGTLIAATRPREALGGRLYDNTAWRTRMFTSAEPTIEPARLTLAGAAPSHWVFKLGSEGDQRWLTGEWNGREAGHDWGEIPGATMRWSSARCGVLLPLQPGVAHTVRLSLSVPALAGARGGIRVRLDGEPLGLIASNGKQDLTFQVPARRSGTGLVARLDFIANGWKPSEHSVGSQDSRVLGFSLRQVEVIRSGADRDPPTEATLRYEMNRAGLEPLTRFVGKGRTVMLKGRAADTATIAMLAASMSGAPVDGQIDGRFATVTDSGVLWLDWYAPRIEIKPRP